MWGKSNTAHVVTITHRKRKSEVEKNSILTPPALLFIGFTPVKKINFILTN